MIEDDRKAARLLARGFQEEGFVVDVAETGEAGEEQATVNEYDVIVLDWLLPGKDGIAVCRALRARDLAGFDPEPTDAQLIVEPPEELDFVIRAKADAVPGAIPAAPSVLDEALGGEFRTMEVPARESDPAEQKLARFPGADRS